MDLVHMTDSATFAYPWIYLYYVYDINLYKQGGLIIGRIFNQSLCVVNTSTFKSMLRLIVSYLKKLSLLDVQKAFNYKKKVELAMIWMATCVLYSNNIYCVNEKN
jgi:hypothetical protein